LTVCPAGTALEGVAISLEQNGTDVTGPMGEPDGIPDICNPFVTCPDDSNLPGVNVTDIELCDLVSEELKGCNTCILFGVGGTDGNAAFQLISGINAFFNATTGEQGAEAVCHATNVTTTMSTIINATTDGVNRIQANLLFKDCIADVKANAELGALSVGGFNYRDYSTSTISNDQIQTSSMMQSSQKPKVFNQNVEVNKQIEQPKKTSILPWWKYLNHK
jgi:hypothetical protein